MVAFFLLIGYHYHHARSDWTAIIATILLLALGDSVWESQPPAILQSFYGLDRERNAAMANLKMWQALGNCVQFVLGVVLTGENNMVVKSFLLAVCLTIGYLCLVILDYKVCKLDRVKGESQLLLAGIVADNQEMCIVCCPHQIAHG